MADRIEGLNSLPHFGRHDPTMFESVVDTSPTLDNWSNVPQILADMDFVMGTLAAAYDGALYLVSKYKRGDEDALDIPIGAAIGNPATGQIFVGVAQDKRLGNPRAHAEVMAIDNARRLGIEIGGLTIASTVEPCPACLDTIHGVGLKRVAYGASREDLESILLVKPHELKAPDIVRAGRAAENRFGFEFFQVPNRAVRAACLEIFDGFSRDTQTGVMTFDPEAARRTRYTRFLQLVNEDRSGLGDRVAKSEKEALIRQFTESLTGFYNN